MRDDQVAGFEIRGNAATSACRQDKVWPKFFDEILGCIQRALHPRAGYSYDYVVFSKVASPMEDCLALSVDGFAAKVGKDTAYLFFKSNQKTNHL
jgi:hypothetical protein